MFLFKSKSYQKFQIFQIAFYFLIILFIASCAPSKRFTGYKGRSLKDYKNEVRVLLADSISEVKTETDVYLISENEKVALIKAANMFRITPVYESLLIQLGSKNFNSKVFYLESVNDPIIFINNKKYRGRIKFINIGSQVKVINQIGLEDYLKGVMTKEMPVGNGNENFEALKAFAIAARTYALNKIYSSQTYFDLFPDVRDQVYGGVESEHTLSNKAVDETRGMILTYKNAPAIVFYHSTCGGYTESAVNVFTKDDPEYLRSVKDGDIAYCSISPNFNWRETLTEKEFIKRLADAKLTANNDYSIEKFIIKSRFPSGRINELEIYLKNKNDIKPVSIFGNQIRSIIKNQSGNGILRSNNFIIEITSDRNIVITGKGSGHGVGLCQWGAIAQSKSGKNHKEILLHYFPGTEIKQLND
ncbi:SpoIID/LytB domain-containing protein [Ignavibacterium album]|uniref:SpoIID/LytB domain-containing protein n=1 Tax=Ignavibacterium album TaxID=591197 RepID=UPI0026EE4FB8|nr:SpoIID/LytB domain-containing protein [Ignavibacterium album]